MLQTDMRVMFVYPQDQPLTDKDREGCGAITLILYYSDSFGDFYKSDLLQSLLPIMTRDCLIVLVDSVGQAKK